MPGWGDVFGKIFDWLPGRKESMLNRIRAIKEEMHAIQTKPGKLTANDAVKLVRLANELSLLEERVGTTG